MVVVTYIVLAWFGLALGSFINALVWRLHEQSKRQRTINNKQKAKNSKLETKDSRNLSILNGRSVCPNCGHKLAWYDLIPVLSWALLKGHCHYCKKSISIQYPLVELALALVFTLSYAFWPVGISGGQWVLFITWLLSSVGLLALLVYDLRWMLLPNKIIYPTLAVAAVGRAVYLVGYEPRKPQALLYWLLGVAVASGLFWILFRVSGGKWIGYGDIRLGLITGTLLATPAKSFLMIFLASVMGVAFIMPALITGKKTLASKLSYGPFLITAAAICILLGQSIIEWYKRVFLP